MNEPIQPTAAITITLQAQEWNQVLSVLSDAPFRIAAPLINQITQQAQQVAPQGQQQFPLNGGDHTRTSGRVDG